MSTKRMLDIVLSAVGLVVLSPVIMLCALIARWETGETGVFRQERVGKNRKTFTLLKIRTMRAGTPQVATHLVGNNAVTPFGDFLRKTKLDELPQLINVIKVT